MLFCLKSLFLSKVVQSQLFVLVQPRLEKLIFKPHEQLMSITYSTYLQHYQDSLQQFLSLLLIFGFRHLIGLELLLSSHFVLFTYTYLLSPYLRFLYLKYWSKPHIFWFHSLAQMNLPIPLPSMFIPLLRYSQTTFIYQSNS